MNSAPQSQSSFSSPSSSPARPIRWGILGAGGIADKVCTDLVARGQSVITAVAAGTPAGPPISLPGTARPRGYGSYADLVADDEVDVV